MPDQGRKELIIDQGNSFLKAGMFMHGRLEERWRIANTDRPALTALLAGSAPHRIGFGSVGLPDPGLMDLLCTTAPVTVISSASPTPVRTLYIDPESLGIDRLANAVGIALLFPGRPGLAIDLGTCVTYDLVDALAVHRGGIISPGMRMRAQAMHAYSAKLPEVDPAWEVPMTGTDTRTSLAAGVLHGMVMEVRGLVQHFRQQYPDLAVVLTGGDAPRFTSTLKSGIFAHPTLTLLGLHAILHY